MKVNITSILFIVGLLTMGGIMIMKTGTEHPGKTIYTELCQSCHLEEGEGLGALIPPLAQADYLINNRDYLPYLLKYGIHDTITVNGTEYTDSMPGINSFHPIEIANVLNYIGRSWGNDMEPFSVREVRENLVKYGGSIESGV